MQRAAIAPSPEDAELAAAVARGDRQAEAEIYRRLAPRVRLYGLRHLRDPHAAGDLVQQVMLTTLERLRAGEVREPGKLASFVLGMCRMVVLDLCSVLDTLVLARQMHPGQRNSLDALCKRYSVDNSHRDLHGALLDAKILSAVYLAMTGGQGAFTLGVGVDFDRAAAGAIARITRPAVPLIVIRATSVELEAHERALAAIDKASSGNTLWRL